MGFRAPHPSILPAPVAKVQLGVRILSLLLCTACLALFIVLVERTEVAAAMSFFTVAWIMLVDIVDIIGISGRVRRLARSPPKGLLILDLLAVVFTAIAITRMLLFVSFWYNNWTECNLGGCDSLVNENRPLEFAAVAALGLVAALHVAFVVFDIREIRKNSRLLREAEARGAVLLQSHYAQRPVQQEQIYLQQRNEQTQKQQYNPVRYDV